MKILYYTHTYFLDCDLPLLKALKEKQHEIYLIFEIVPYQLKSTIVNIQKQLPQTDIVPITEYKEFNIYSNFIDTSKSFILNRNCAIYNSKNIGLRKKFARLIKNINPDIIHCTDFIDLDDLFLYKYRNKIVQIVHDPFPHSGEDTIRKKIKRYLGLKLIEKFVLLNNKQLNQFQKEFNIPPYKVHTNSLGTYDCIKAYQTIPSTKAEQILYFGRISQYKGIEYLLQAMEYVHKERPNAQLVIAGGGNFYFDITPYQNKNYIKIINRYISTEELYQLLSTSCLVVCPYTDATQSGVIMSAFTLDIPVIATNVGGLPNTVEHEKTGILVPPRNSNSIAKSIIHLLKNPNLIEQYTNNIKEQRLFGKYSWNRIADNYISIYDELLNKNSK